MALERSWAYLLMTSGTLDRKSTRLNSSHSQISYAVFCLKKKRLRLGSYRAAVAAGFYSEFPRRARRTDVRLLQRLFHPPPTGETQLPRLPFPPGRLGAPR